MEQLGLYVAFCINSAFYVASMPTVADVGPTHTDLSLASHAAKTGLPKLKVEIQITVMHCVCEYGWVDGWGGRWEPELALHSREM